MYSFFLFFGKSVIILLGVYGIDVYVKLIKLYKRQKENDVKLK